MIPKQELEKEIKYLTNVIEIVKTKLNDADDNLSAAKEEALSFKKYIYNECQALATSQHFDKRQEYMDIINEADEKVHLANKMINQKQKLSNSLNSPFFGKLIFNDEDVYIGINGIERDFIYYVYDWRSPIASLYYNYNLGKAEFKTPAGVEKGNITQKRQFKIVNSDLKWCIENSQNIDDDLLGEILSKSSSDKLTNIVNTIQKEQNLIIRNSEDKVLITEGVAGSGKTEIALHRIAYLLYNNESFNSNNVLIFSPNTVFTEYISGVLPELSEENVLSTTYHQLATKYIDKEIESYDEFLDRVYNKKEKIVEFDNEFISKLDEYLKNYIEKIEFRTGLIINEQKFSKEQLNELLNKYKKLTLLERINTISLDLLEFFHLKKKYHEKIKEKIVSLLTNSIEPINIYNEFLSSLGQNIIENKVLYNHITPLLYTIFNINDYPYETNIKHIVIDEAQDYSLLQIKIIKTIFSKATFTILGDINQSLNPFVNYGSLEEYGKIFENYRYIKLNKSYRSTKNIMDFASKLLNINIQNIREEGTDVIIKDNDIKTDILETINKLDSPKVGIITKDKKDTEMIYNLLQDKIDVSSPVIDSKNEKIVILPIYLAKGLEFESAILYNLYSNNNNKLLYVAATRAQNNLIVYKGE